MERVQQRIDARGDPDTFAIIGAAMEVHTQLGPGFLEAVYREALALELQGRAVAHERELALPLQYKGQPLSCSYRPDFVCCGRVLVEVKASAHVGPADRAQVINYLTATGLEIGLLLNFGAGRLEFERFIRSARQQRVVHALEHQNIWIPTTEVDAGWGS